MSRPTLRACVIALGAASSIGLMFYSGRKNPSIALLVLFAAWVAGPFGGLMIADRKAWLRSYPFTLSLSALSFLIHGATAFDPPLKMASVFLVTPTVSWF